MPEASKAPSAELPASLRDDLDILHLVGDIGEGFQRLLQFAELTLGTLDRLRRVFHPVRCGLSDEGKSEIGDAASDDQRQQGGDGAGNSKPLDAAAKRREDHAEHESYRDRQKKRLPHGQRNTDGERSKYTEADRCNELRVLFNEQEWLAHADLFEAGNRSFASCHDFGRLGVQPHNV